MESRSPAMGRGFLCVPGYLTSKTSDVKNYPDHEQFKTNTSIRRKFMKTITAVLLTASAALIFAACGAPPANNTPANTNANTTKPAPAAPTADALFDMDKKANEAYTKGDSAFFDGFLSDKFTMLGNKGEHYAKADTVKMIGGTKCDIKSMDLTEPQMAKIDADTYVISYKATWDGTCTENGKATKIPSPVREASVYVRNGEKWLGAWHGETKIMGEKTGPPAKANPLMDDNPKAPAKKDQPKAETKKPEAKSAEAKKADPSGAAPATALTTAKPANAAPAAKPTADPNTDALMKIHTSGWEAWKARDAKKLSDLTSADLSFVEATGMWYGTKDAVIKAWTEPKCDIKSTSLADGFAQALSPTVEVLYSKGTAAGTCTGPDGKPMKLGALWGTAVYVKEGNDWKLAFLFESPA
jgi:ketosteroid isomerase-like protein